MAAIKAARPKFLSIAAEIRREAIAKHALYAVEHKKLFRPTKRGGIHSYFSTYQTISPIQYAWLSWIENMGYSRKTKTRTSGDIDVSWTLCPVGSKVLCLFCANEPEFTKLWQSFSWVKDYHYQNQTDPPEEVPAREWRQRSRDWDKALERGTGSTEGWSQDLFVDWDYGTCPALEELVKYINGKYPPKKRAMALVQNKFTFAFMEKHKGEELGHYYDALRKLKEPDTQRKLTAQAKKVSMRIKPVTAEDLKRERPLFDLKPVAK